MRQQTYEEYVEEQRLLRAAAKPPVAHTPKAKPRARKKRVIATEPAGVADVADDEAEA